MRFIAAQIIRMNPMYKVDTYVRSRYSCKQKHALLNEKVWYKYVRT